MSYGNIIFGNIVSFDVYPDAIIGTTFKDVKVLGVFDKDTANNWIDADAMHINVYPTLPNGVPDNPNQYEFVKLKHTNGNVSVIGLPWIREETIVLSAAGTLKLTLDNMSPTDKDRIVATLAAIGYRVSKVELI